MPAFPRGQRAELRDLMVTVKRYWRRTVTQSARLTPQPETRNARSTRFTATAGGGSKLSAGHSLDLLGVCPSSAHSNSAFPTTPPSHLGADQSWTARGLFQQNLGQPDESNISEETHWFYKHACSQEMTTCQVYMPEAAQFGHRVRKAVRIFQKRTGRGDCK